MTSHQSTKISGVDKVEIKVTLRPDQELKGLRVMELNVDTAEVRKIYFFDTPDLTLFNSGVILRARLVKGGDDDSTVKIRAGERPQVSPEWQALEGFKLEADLTGDRLVYSASLSAPQKSEEIADAAKGERPIQKLFFREQERFLAQYSKVPVVFAALRVLGPIQVLRWKWVPKDFGQEVTVEEWRLPDGEDLLEVSIKVDSDGAENAQKAFDGHLRKHGLDPAGAQETKTRTALQYFADEFREK